MPLKDLGIMCKEILEACKKFKECDLGKEYEIPIKELIKHLEFWPEYELTKQEGDMFEVLESYANQMTYGTKKVQTIDCGKFKETLEKLQSKIEVNQFLEYLKEMETDGMGCHFDYSIINIEDINDILLANNNVNINIQINNNYYQRFYNSIIYWVFDGENINIYDWYNLRINIINEFWFDENQKKEIIERFSSVKINDILKPFDEQLQNFMKEKEGLNHCPDNLEKGCFFVMYGDDYILVEPDRSYWYEEDDGTIVYRINEID